MVLPVSLETLFSHASIVERALDARLANRVRSRAYERYALVDRGSYEHAPFDDVADQTSVCALAAAELGHALRPIGARVLRLRPGDYLLARHDDVHAEIARGDSRRRFELVLDLSPAAAAAEIHYRRRGQVFFRVPCAPGTLAIVERTPAITCNHTYVSKLADTEVVRLVIQAVG